MAKQGNLFALTSPDGTVGIFHQLGTATPGRISVQNCLVEKFGKGKVFIGKGLCQSGGYLHLNSNRATSGIGYFNTPGGIYLVERITAVDPRYNTSSVIKEYAEFFGRKTVKAVEADTPKRLYKKQIKEHSNQQVAALELLDKLISTLGYIKSEPNIVAFRRAAKRKK